MAFCVCNTIRFENVELLVIFPRGPLTFFSDVVLKMPVVHARDSYCCWEVKIPCTVSESELPSFHFHPFSKLFNEVFSLRNTKAKVNSVLKSEQYNLFCQYLFIQHYAVYCLKTRLQFFS